MTAQNDRSRPYGSTAGLISFCERARSRNLPEQIGDDFFRLAGVAGQSIRRTRHSLVFLELLSDTGEPTATLRELAAAPEDGWRGHLRSAVDGAYRTDLEQVDPAKDDQAVLRSWFQKYEPRSQTHAMTSLFLGLCRESGMEVKEPTRARGQRKTRAAPPNGTVSIPKRTESRRNARAATRLPAESAQSTATPVAGAALFAITSEMIGDLDDEEFAAVWEALGVVARTRARVMRAKGGSPPMEEELEESDG